MKLYLIELKNFPGRFVGKLNASYAVRSDQRVKEAMAEGKTLAKALGEDFWFVEDKYAKVFTQARTIRSLVTSTLRGETTMPTFDEFLVTVIDTNAGITKVSLTDLYHNREKYKD
jgi:hypothetical protein